MNLNEARQAIADDVLKRIARRYANCEVRIFPDMPELTPVEAVLRCAAEEGFILTIPTTIGDFQRMDCGCVVRMYRDGNPANETIRFCQKHTARDLR